jgi:hypothetical protein
MALIAPSVLVRERVNIAFNAVVTGFFIGAACDRAAGAEGEFCAHPDPALPKASKQTATEVKIFFISFTSP